jgi:hypothetical protein
MRVPARPREGGEHTTAPMAPPTAEAANLSRRDLLDLSPMIRASTAMRKAAKPAREGAAEAAPGRRGRSCPGKARPRPPRSAAPMNGSIRPQTTPKEQHGALMKVWRSWAMRPRASPTGASPTMTGQHDQHRSRPEPGVSSMVVATI